VGKPDQRQERDAAAVHYAAVSSPKDAREECESREDQAEVLRDEAAEKLRRRGFNARDAAVAVDAVLAVLSEADRQLCAGVVAGASENVLAKAEALEALRVMAVKLVQAPKPRFSAGCFLLAMGADHPGVKSERQWAAQQHMSHEHASNEVEEWQKSMRLPKTSGQKTEKARKVYQETNGKL
jgi:hypothetical protein